jgi:glucose/arabinose dehydrogenase
MRMRALLPLTAAPAAALALLLLLFPAAAALAAPFEVAGPLRGVSLRQLATGLGSITAIAHSSRPGAPRQVALALRDGRVVWWDGSRVLPEPLLDIRPLVGTEGEGGLLGIAFHLRFHQNGLFFVHYTDTAGDTQVVRYRTLPGNLDRADPASAVVFLAVDQPFSNHNGGQIAFAADGYLYIGLGDGGAAGDPQCRAQRRDSLLGKILRLDVNRSAGGRPYAIPPDNPFRNGPFRPEVWAVGLRNPWRFSFDRATSNLWIADVGQGEREEIDVQPVLQGGVNWGWNPMEGSLCFGGNNCPDYVPSCNSPALAAPLLEYGHDDGDCSVTGGYVYRGLASARLNGTYLFGDFCSGRIWGAALQGTRYVVRELRERARLLTTFGETSAGEIYLGTADGRLLELVHDGIGQRVGLYDPVLSQFHLKEANEPGPAETRFGFGRRRGGWLPLAGDWDGDGRDSVGFYDPARGLFRLRDLLSPGVAQYLFRFGPPNAGWLPVTGDWDGDRRDSIGVYDPSHSVFHLKSDPASGEPTTSVAFGPPGAGWLPVAGQFDSDPGEEVGLYDPVNAVFHLQTAAGERTQAFGPPNGGWLPLVGDWDGDGLDGIGLYDPAASRFHLNNLNGQPTASFQFGQGNAGWRPIAGNW